jgi:dGTPase
VHNEKQGNQFEESILAAYATKSAESRGRRYKEPEHPYRSAYQRDRDRIIHSTAFRRLEYKTQVFVYHEGDDYRTRLTHSIEVAQIARTISGALGLNPDLTEAIALAHDLGHTPFGHAGEEALNELMKRDGGFNHNRQSLRVVDLLEERYPDFPGLNLTWEVREGIAKHSTAFDIGTSAPDLAPNEMPVMETQVVDIADEIAYDNHDLDDGLTSGLIKEEELALLPLWGVIIKKIGSSAKDASPVKRKCLIIRTLINEQVTDLINQTQKNIDTLKLRSSPQVKKLDKKVVSFSKDMLKLRKPLRDFLMEKLYHHYRVIRMSTKAKRFITDMFGVYVQKPLQLPNEIQNKIPRDGVKKAVCDYIAGMTDRYALDEHKKLFDPYAKV